MRVRQETVELHSSVAAHIKDHSKKQAEKGNYEAVGFVARDIGDLVGIAAMPLNNHAPNPREAFFVEPWEQFRAEQRLAEKGYEILGVYHSHPNSEALPSMTDHTMARPGEYVFIYSVVFDELRAYREEDGTLAPVDLITEEESP